MKINHFADLVMMEKLLWILPLALMSCVRVESAQILEIDDGILISVTQLLTQDKFLNLSSLHLKSISPEAFDKVTHVTSLDLSNNKINELPESVFSKLTNLEELSLANNCDNLKFISNQFSSLKKLKSLDVSGKFVYSNSSMFVGLPDDAEIKIASNTFTVVSPTMFNVDTSRQFDKSDSSRFNCHGDFSKAYKDFLKLENETYHQNASMSNSVIDERMICMSDDGMVENVVGALGKENCRTLNFTNECLNLRNQSIRGFKKNWYNSTNTKDVLLLLDENAIEEIDENILNDLPSSIVSVYFNKNNIKMLKNNVMNNSNIYHLDFSENSIHTIESNAFEGFPSLLILEFIGNSITDLQFATGLPKSLEVLDVGANYISELPNDVFANLSNLIWLSIFANEVEVINERAFVGLNNLVTLAMEKNNITRVEKGPWDHLPCIKQLSFNSNNIKSIEKGFASKMNNLQDLSFYNTMELTKFDTGLFYGLPLNSQIFLPSNVESIRPGMFKKDEK